MAKANTPSSYSHEQLDDARQEALGQFVARRGKEGSRLYEEAFARELDLVTHVFKQTKDLLAFSSAVFEREPSLLWPARYLAAPPISADDLDTLVGGSVARRRRLDKDSAERAVEILQAAWDPIRFPWIKESRRPTAAERNTALKWTAGILAIERTRTYRRGESSKRQEGEVVSGLERLHWTKANKRRVDDLDDLPRGSFAHRVKLANVECDIAVRLKNGKLLAVECKVSNSAINSIKRLTHEVGDKAARWRTEFGERVVPAAVLAGVFKLVSLIDAQDNHRITLFWEHDLDRLFEFVGPAHST